MNKGLKIFGIVALAVFVTLMTVGCIYFGYFYFKGDDSNKTLSKAQTRDLVNTASKDFGFVPQTQQSESSQFYSFMLQEFEDNEIGNEVASMIGATLDGALGTALTLSKVAIDIEELDPYTSYAVSASEEVYGVIRYYADDDTVYFLLQNGYSASSMNITKEADGYEITAIVKDLANHYIQYDHYEVKSGKLVLASDMTLYFTGDEFPTTFTDTSAITSLDAFWCSTESHEFRFTSTTEGKHYGDLYADALTQDSVKLQYANEVLRNTKNVKILTAEEISTLDLTDLPEDFFQVYQSYRSELEENF